MLDKTKDTILQLAKEASIDLLEEKRSIDEILNTCKNFCKMAQILNENSWIELEIKGYHLEYKTTEELCQNLPNYRKTNWKFYDVYGNPLFLPPGIVDLFGKSVVYHSIKEIEEKDILIIEAKFLEKFNKFISEYGMDHNTKSIRIHEARISKEETSYVIKGLKSRIQSLLDTIITLLEIEN